MKINKHVLWLAVCSFVLTVFLVTGCAGGQKQVTPTPSVNPSAISQPSVSVADDGVFEVTVNGTKLTAVFADNAAARELKGKLSQNDLTLTLKEYGGFEKVGDLGFSLPASDESIAAKAGDIVLYQGNKLSVFYGDNTWDYTRLGTIQNADSQSLRNFFGEGDVTVTLSLPR